jgi:Tol biopolymer transport system component
MGSTGKKGDLAEFPIIRGAIIQWAPDSSYAAYTSYVSVRGEDRRVFLIAHNGGQRQPITSAVYPVPGFRYHSFTWSPNSRYLALVGESVDYSHPELTTLYIYDRLNNQYSIQCPLPDFHPFM